MKKLIVLLTLLVSSLSGERCAIVLQAGFRCLHLAGNDRLGHALCTARQRGQGVLSGLCAGLRFGSGINDHRGLFHRQPYEDVPYRVSHRHLLPQRPGWNRRRGNLIGLEPDVVDALRANLHSHRWCVNSDLGDHTFESFRLMQNA